MQHPQHKLRQPPEEAAASKKTKAQLVREAARFRERVAALERSEVERRRTEEELRRSEERYERITKAVTDYIHTVRVEDGQPVETTHSEACLAVTGYASAEFAADPLLWLRMVVEEDVEAVLAQAADILAGATPAPLEHRIVRQDGALRWVRNTPVKHYDAEGTLVGYDGLIRDITERKHAEESLHRRSEALEQSLDGIVITDLAGNLQFVNRAWAAMHGFTPAELMGKHLSLCHAPEQAEEELRPFLDRTRAQRGVQDEVGHQNRNGASFPTRMTGSVLTDHAGKPVGMIVTAQDISAERQLEMRLRQSEKMDAIGQLAGGIAHDFNNQLAGIMGFAEMLLRGLDDDRLRRYAKHILSASRHSAELTRQLLAFSRQGQYQAVPVDVHEAVPGIVALLQRSIDKRITIRQKLSASASVVIGDPGQLDKTFLNLALNARDAMPGGGEIAFTTRSVRLGPKACREHQFPLKPGSYLQICVADTGAGIGRENIEHIFEPFFSTKAAGEGTGMGLAAVYGTVQHHQGAVSVRSKVGRGTTFTLLLPLATPDAPAEPDGSIVPAPRQANILLVDDEHVVAEMAAEMLRRLGYSVTVREDGLSAVEYYREAWRDIDLVIMDMVLPKVGGGDAVTAMRLANADVKVLLSSGYSANHEVERLLADGLAAGFVPKPFQGAELSRKVAALL